MYQMGVAVDRRRAETSFGETRRGSMVLTYFGLRMPIWQRNFEFVPSTEAHLEAEPQLPPVCAEPHAGDSVLSCTRSIRGGDTVVMRPTSRTESRFSKSHV